VATAGADKREHPRFSVPLAVEVGLASGTVMTTTTGVSRGGVSLRLDPRPAIDEVVTLALTLPDGQLVSAVGRCRRHTSEGQCGLSLELDAAARQRWESFVEQEESTGSLWRMIGRVAAAPDDALAPRGLVQPGLDDTDAQRFHTVGENGLAYRLAFQRHPADAPDVSDLCAALPGFREAARGVVRRVLREDFLLRFEDGGEAHVVRARVVELLRGGFARVRGDDRTPVSFTSLGAGELFLVERGGAPVFPGFDALELEQIACDTFRDELRRPMFQRRAGPAGAPATPAPGRTEPASGPVPAPVELPQASSSSSSAVDASGAPSLRPPSRRFQHGYDAVRFAQAASEDVQRRRYGSRDIYFHPSVWAKVRSDAGAELMGPTLQDGAHICVLALVGPGAPRVVRLTTTSEVSLLKPPKT
jgi:hypothetical protein